MNHAFFEALLLPSAGSVIHAVSDEQDMLQKMEGLALLLPFTNAMMPIGVVRKSSFALPSYLSQ